MPLAIGIGRRIVFLIATAILGVGAVLCATAQSYDWHLGSRMVVGLAAGQSESLVPMITQVCNFQLLPFYVVRIIDSRRKSSSSTNGVKLS